MDELFARAMAAAEINVAGPTKRDRAKSAAWLGLADRLKTATDVPVALLDFRSR